MIAPCACAGSMAYVHPSCLNQWRAHNVQQSLYCGVCNTAYNCLECPTVSYSCARQLLCCQLDTDWLATPYYSCSSYLASCWRTTSRSSSLMHLASLIRHRQYCRRQSVLVIGAGCWASISGDDLSTAAAAATLASYLYALTVVYFLIAALPCPAAHMVA